MSERDPIFSPMDWPWYKRYPLAIAILVATAAALFYYWDTASPWGLAIIAFFPTLLALTYAFEAGCLLVLASVAGGLYWLISLLEIEAGPETAKYAKWALYGFLAWWAWNIYSHIDKRFTELQQQAARFHQRFSELDSKVASVEWENEMLRDRLDRLTS